MSLLSNVTNINRISSDRHEQTLKEPGIYYLIGPPFLLSKMEEKVLIFGAIEDRIEWGYLVR